MLYSHTDILLFRIYVDNLEWTAEAWISELLCLPFRLGVWTVEQLVFSVLVLSEVVEIDIQ